MDAFESPQEEPRRGVDLHDFYSFIVFSAMVAFSIAILPEAYWFFAFLILIDGVGTFFNSAALVAFDRAVCAISLVILSAVLLSFNAIYLILEALLAFVVLDLGFLLRKFSDTNVESPIIKKRIWSYAYVIVPSFLLSYALIFFYSFVPQSADVSALILGLSSIGAFLIVLVVARYFLLPANLAGHSED
jgi:hypothetical protein